MERLTKTLYGLVGRRLAHSFSLGFFNRKFESEHINALYENFEMESIEKLRDVIRDNSTLAGVNVTIPYKQDVISLLDEIDDDARLIGAVNVVKIHRGADGRYTLKGFNSDMMGFHDSIAPMLKPDVHTHALILGTGGASKAVHRALEKAGLKVTFVSRTARPGQLTYADLDERVMAENLVIVNCTPLGMYPDIDSCPDIPYALLTPDHLCYDLTYNPDVTTFMRKSAEHGAVTKNGLEMLLLQAMRSWEIWTSDAL
jgi:shikimate dehydrogenase